MAKSEKKVVIVGAGGHGKVVLDILLESKAKVLGFIDDDKKKLNQSINGLKVLGGWDYLKNKKNIQLALGIGNNEVRKKFFDYANKEGIELVCAIHPKAVVAKSVTMGQGVVVMAGAVVNPCVVVEDGVVINTGATVDHDCHLKKFCHIWPGAHLAGTITVGECSYVGTGAAVIQNINIANNVVIGAGAVVISDIPGHVTVAGVPAKIIKENRKI